MTTDNQPQVPASVPSADAIWTTGTLTLIAIGVVAALLLIWWGARLKRQRKAAEREVLERQEDRYDTTPAVALPPAAGLAPTVPPVAPPPPPLEPGDTPVPAAAPLDASAVAGADDLTLLKGVGPKLAARLGELGFTRFAQIAALSPTDAAALDAQLGSFQGRMTRDRWIDQARHLAADDRAAFEAEFGKL